MSHTRHLSDTVSSIKQSALRFLSGTALSRVTGMIRDIILAFSFGTNEALAALFVAYRLSNVCRRLFGEGALQSAFIPLFEEARKEDEVRAFRFFRDVSALLSLFLIGFIVVGMLVLWISLSAIDYSPGNREIVFLTILLLPSLLPICLFGLNASLLQCQKHYFTVGIAPCAFNLSISAAALLFHQQTPQAAMPYLAVSIVLGCAFQWWVTLGQTIRHTRQILSGSILTGIKFLSHDVKRLFWPLLLGILGVGASQINNTVDALFARAADPEGPAQLWYGIRFQQLPLALFGIALSGALLPPLSRAIHAGNKSEYLHFLEFALRKVGALLYPCTLALIPLGLFLVNAVYGHGDFQAHSVLTTTGCLHGYCIGLVPMGWIIVMAPAFYARRDYITPMKGAAISLVSNLVLNAFMVYGLHWGAVSVALATSISSWLNAYYLYHHLKKEFGPIMTPEGTKESRRVIFATLLAGAATYIFASLIYFPPVFFSFGLNNLTDITSSFWEQISQLAVVGFSFLGFLALFAKICRASDILTLVHWNKQV